jgi:hypothetical protein
MARVKTVEESYESICGRGSGRGHLLLKQFLKQIS